MFFRDLSTREKLWTVIVPEIPDYAKRNLAYMVPFLQRTLAKEMNEKRVRQEEDQIKLLKERIRQDPGYYAKLYAQKKKQQEDHRALQVREKLLADARTRELEAELLKRRSANFDRWKKYFENRGVATIVFTDLEQRDHLATSMARFTDDTLSLYHIKEFELFSPKTYSNVEDWIKSLVSPEAFATIGLKQLYKRISLASARYEKCC